MSKGTKGDRLLFKFPYYAGSVAPSASDAQPHPNGGRLSQLSHRKAALHRIGLNPYSASAQKDIPISRPMTLDDSPDSLLEESRLTGFVHCPYLSDTTAPGVTGRH